MLYTTIPSFIITIILFIFIGRKYSDIGVDTESLNKIFVVLNQEFNITSLLFIIPLITIILVVKKVPAIPGLFCGTLIGGVGAVIFQGATVKDFITALQIGYVSNSGNQFVDELLTRGGMNSMMWTVTLIICALFLGGAMERAKMLSTVANKVLSIAKSTGSLILATVFTSIATNILAAEQYLSIVITGRIYKDAYASRNLHPTTLSRVLEDAGTMTSPLIPWNSCGAYMMAALGIAPWIYVPYCFLNLINPIISIIYGYTGFSIRYIDSTKVKKIRFKSIFATNIFGK